VTQVHSVFPPRFCWTLIRIAGPLLPAIADQLGTGSVRTIVAQS